jgi:hypothetical protein
MKSIFLIVIASFLFFSCDENSVSSNTFEAEDTETHLITLSTQLLFIVENTNGTVTITASDTASNIYCDIVKKVTSKESENDAQAHLQDIDITIAKNSASVKMEVDHPMNTERNYEIGFDIIIPNDFNFALTLGNGNIDLQTRTRAMNINLGNGNVFTDVTLQDSCSAAVTLGNGNINFTIPGNTNAKLSASVGNGIITNSGLNFQNQQSSNNQFNGTLGNGSGNIALILGNGNLSMIKK